MLLVCTRVRDGVFMHFYCAHHGGLAYHALEGVKVYHMYLVNGIEAY